METMNAFVALPFVYDRIQLAESPGMRRLLPHLGSWANLRVYVFHWIVAGERTQNIPVDLGLNR